MLVAHMVQVWQRRLEHLFSHGKPYGKRCHGKHRHGKHAKASSAGDCNVDVQQDFVMLLRMCRCKAASNAKVIAAAVV
jgi:hypothetical protein